MLWNNKVLLWLFLAAGTSEGLSVPMRASADSAEGNFVVYADDSFVADVVVFEAERVQQHLTRCFGLESSMSRIPVILIMGDAAEKKSGADRGVVRIFQKPFTLRLQVQWDEMPVSLNSFHHGWIRALCTRLAIERLPRRTRVGSSKENEGELRVPVWITEGVTGLLAEFLTEEKIQERATLLAKINPALPLDAAIFELEGKAELDSMQRALATVFCHALTRDPATRERFLSNLSWNSTTTMKNWLEMVVANKNLDGWWRTAWKNQAAQFSRVRLSYTATLNWILEQENASGSVEKSSSVFPNRGTFETGIGTAGHPWFRTLITNHLSGSGHDRSRTEIEQLRKDIQFRRAAALDWFGALELSKISFTRQEWLLRDRFYLDHEKRARTPGFVKAWFDKVERRQDM